MTQFIHGTPSRPEFGEMFGGWLTEREGRAFLIDCGVGTGGSTLAERLSAQLNGRPLNYVLLTHIHMDHAGGLAEIIKRWPDVLIVAHRKGIRHLVEPRALWEGTVKVMGELADMYGRPQPVDRARLIPHTECDIPGLTIFETPGHAPHHLSYRLGGTMFAGEAGGCPYVADGRLYSRPATPPRYFPATTISSIDLLLKENDREGYFGHTHESLPYRQCLEMYRAQLLFWQDFFSRPEAAPRPQEKFEDRLERLTDEIFTADPNLEPLTRLSPQKIQVERYFMRNSVEGFLRYLAESAEAPHERA